MRRSMAALATFAVLVAHIAHALPPQNYPNSTAPACIRLVGLAQGVPAAAFGEFEVVLRDLPGLPVPGVAVAIDLQGVPELVLASDPHDPLVTVVTPGKRVSKLTDANGSVRFTLVGRGNGQPPSTLLNGGRIYAGPTDELIGSPTVSAFDLDGVGGVGANDLSLWFQDFGGSQPYGRSDFDCSGTIGANDFSVWLAAFGSGAMPESGGAATP